MAYNKIGPNEIPFECLNCEWRFSATKENAACDRCQHRPDSENVVGLPEVPENSVRIYCRACDFEEVVHRDDAKFPERLAQGRAYLHESQGHHQVGYEYNVDFNDEDEIAEQYRICGVKESEESLQEWLENYFEEHGWVAVREVSPHGSSYKADLIVEHDDYGWMGIETKYFDSDGGAKIAHTHHQIVTKYRQRRYLGNKIDLWAICPYFQGAYRRNGVFPSQNDWRHRLIREMFCSHGMGFIDLQRKHLSIDFSYSNALAKIPVDGDEARLNYESVDMAAIKENVQKKMEKYRYS